MNRSPSLSLFVQSTTGERIPGSLFRLFCMFTVAIGSLAISHSKAIGQVEAGKPNPEKLFEPRQYTDEEGNLLNYRLLKPDNYNPSKKYPLVIFLHGAGERGDDNVAQLKHGMADFCREDRRSEYPCYVLAPQCPKNQKWADVDWSRSDVKLPEKISTSLTLVMEVVDSMLEDAAVDKQRIYITGLSMGGYGTWDALYRRPNFFAAAAPICGGADPQTAEKIKHVPIWCFHGDQDRAVRVEFSRNMIEALRESGGTPKYTEYPGVGHDSWTETYSNDELYEWLFSHRVSSQSKSKG